MTNKPHNPRNEKPISLQPLTLEEALRRMLNAGRPHLDEDTKPNAEGTGEPQQGAKPEREP